jgi:hypothetical protein
MLLTVTEPFEEPGVFFGGVISSGFSVGVGVGFTVGVGVGTGFGVGFTVGVGTGFGVGFTVGVGTGFGVGFTVGSGVGVGVGFTVGSGVGVGFTVGSGVGVGAGAGATVGVGAGAGGGVGAGVFTSVNVIVTGADTAVAKVLSPALVAVAIQVPALVAVRSPCKSIAHPDAVPPVTAIVTRPVPLPPDVVSETGVPTVAVPPDKVSVACGALTTPSVTSVDALLRTPPIVVLAVIVNVSAAEIVVGVPVISPEFTSKDSPAGRVPEIV